MRPLRAARTSGDHRADAELLSLVSGGDREALGILYDRYAQQVYAFARHAGGAKGAEDIVQETFLRVGQVAPSYCARTTAARSWIFGIANCILRERRRSSGRLATFLAQLAWRSSDRAQAPRDGAPDLERALATISESKRAVLLLVEVHGFTCPEAATILAVPVGTVWTRLHHARRELAALLGELS